MVNNKESDAWFDLLEKVKVAKRKIGFQENEEVFFRGHSKARYKLLPGLFRSLEGKDKISKEIWEAESDMFYEFQSRARDLHTQNLSDWDILFFMQHHKAKTRLLDWTETFGVALYFALNHLGGNDIADEDYSPCIWMMNPYKFNYECGHKGDLWSPENLNYYRSKKAISYSDILLYKNGSNAFGWDKPVALYPQRKGNRLSNQSGYFTIHGNNTKSIEKISESMDLLVKIDIPKIAIPIAKQFLEDAGINHYSVFPDLDGLAYFLNRKYFKN